MVTYKTIFGARKTKHLPAYPGIPALAVQAVMAYVEEFPDSKNKTTKKRGMINLVQVLHRWRHYELQAHTTRNRKYDLEIFTGVMKNLRGWDPS
eukprot:8473029-Lingulodinium_polyedra.AAC.1